MNQERIAALEKTIETEYGNIAGMVVLREGKVEYENYFHGFAPDDAVHVASVTKSIFSGLIGIAIDKGYIKGVNQRVLDFFPGYTVQPGEKMIQHVKIEHLLTMTAPYKFDSEPFEAFFASRNWVEAALDLLGGEESAGTFRYSPIIGAHILSGILVNATGQSVLDFASKNLFSPLGIHAQNVVFHSLEEQIAWYEKDRHTRGWVVDPQGINTASWGLTLAPMDMAKLGRLYLDGGMWEGKRIVPAHWIDESTKPHAKWGELSYGYLWWILDEKERIYAALGDGGNAIYINAKKNLVVAIASLFTPDAKDRLELIRAHIERW